MTDDTNIKKVLDEIEESISKNLTTLDLDFKPEVWKKQVEDYLQHFSSIGYIRTYNVKVNEEDQTMTIEFPPTFVFLLTAQEAIDDC